MYFGAGIEELLGQENSTYSSIPHDAKYAPTTSKAKTLLLMTVLFIIYLEMKSNLLCRFIVQFLQQQKVFLQLMKEDLTANVFQLKNKRAQHDEIIMWSSSFLKICCV